MAADLEQMRVLLARTMDAQTACETQLLTERKRAEALSLELETAQSELETARSELGAAQSKLSPAETERDALQRKLERAEARIRELEARPEPKLELQQANKAARREIGELKRRLQRMAKSRPKAQQPEPRPEPVAAAPVESRLAGELRSAREECARFEMELEEERRQNVRMQGELEDALAQIARKHE